jgi:cation diffusion facilitator CzcD-associated flavoprotein CzcO/acetyl esterase/lipase
MTSWQARAAALAVRWRVRSALGDMSDIERVRAVFGSPMAPPRGVRFTPATVGGVAGEWVESERLPAGAAAAAPTLMYVHGGGFVGGSPVTHRPVTAAFALHGLRVFVPDYRLAPEHPFPVPLDDVIAAWRGLAEATPAGARLVLAGDSAGGNLALALMLAQRDAHARLPDAAVLFSPSTCLNGESESLRANTGRDPMFLGPALAHLAHAYLGADGDPANPLVSPVRGDLAGLPPLLLHVGADEVLRDDGLRFAAKAREAGVRVELVVWPVVPHAWQLVRALPEARRSVDAAARFLKEAARDEPVEHLDTVIVGAGLSGLGTAARLQDERPGHRFTILEGRSAMGGTWDLFRYPGIRSDSDMYTLGYDFKPWKDAQAIAPGPAIRRYIAETAAERGLDRQVRFGHRVTHADWSSEQARWTLAVDRGPGRAPARMSCRFLLVCGGYYRYDTGHDPEFAGRADFRGTVVHPQFWPEGLEWSGKRVVVIGSGATAVTIVPEMAKAAAHVTMLQRSPSYFLSLPGQDPIAQALKRVLPAMWAYKLVRAKNVLGAWLLFKLSRRWPQKMKGLLIRLARGALGEGQDVETHFTPRYNPWDQRLCIVPDGDIFKAIKSGRAEVVTDTIDRFTEHGIRLASGRELEADIIVTATGLALTALGGIALTIDGRPVDLPQSLAYKSVMLSGVPNLVYTFGYTNSSWTLKADLTARYTCRLFAYMDRHGWAVATPERGPGIEPQPFIDLSSGYVQRSSEHLPKQGSKAPWHVTQDYLRDLATLRFGRIADGTLKFARAPVPTATPASPPLAETEGIARASSRAG